MEDDPPISYLGTKTPPPLIQTNVSHIDILLIVAMGLINLNCAFQAEVYLGDKELPSSGPFPSQTPSSAKATHAIKSGIVIGAAGISHRFRVGWARDSSRPPLIPF